jgi:hypothetical protein
MYRVKQLLGSSLILGDYDGQVIEILPIVRAWNKNDKGRDA